MSRERLLIVEDEEDILELLRYNLQKEGYELTCVNSGEDALKKASSTYHDLVILDLMLPGIDGLEVCKALRANPDTANMSVIILTAKTEETDMVAGLEVGADDYITKPFSPRILVARVRAALRRKKTPVSGNDAVINLPDLLIDPARHKVVSKGKPVELSVTEFKTLHLLANRPGHVFSREQIIDTVHGNDYAVTDRSVDVQIAALRKKLGRTGRCIETIRGVGYRFKE